MYVSFSIERYIVYFKHDRYHENCRIFQDRLVNDEDRIWFRKLLEEKLVESFEIRFDEVVTRSPLFYGDFMIPSAEVKLYHEITDDEKVIFFFTNFKYFHYI